MRNSRSNAFTLAELLIAIGIIVLLVSLLIPAVMRANKTGMRARISGDFQTITMALEAYKQDFGDIPRLPVIMAGSIGFAGNPLPNTGAATLGKALLGPYGDGLLSSNPNNVDQSDPPVYDSNTQYHAGDCVINPATPTPPAVQWVAITDVKGTAPASGVAQWQYFTATDNSDGPGFKVRAGAAKVWGPYIQPGKIKNEGVDLIDASGSVILYFPAHLGAIDVTKDSGSSKDMTEPYVSLNPTSSAAVSLYNATDNLEVFRQNGETDDATLSRIRSMLGDWNCSGFIDNTGGASETAETAVKQDYLLWSAGPDGIFGPTTPVGYTMPIVALSNPTDAMQLKKFIDQCDDVTNFK